MTRETRDGFNLDLAGILLWNATRSDSPANVGTISRIIPEDYIDTVRKKGHNAILIISGRWSLFIIAKIYINERVKKTVRVHNCNSESLGIPISLSFRNLRENPKFPSRCGLVKSLRDNDAFILLPSAWQTRYKSHEIGKRYRKRNSLIMRLIRRSTIIIELNVNHWKLLSTARRETSRIYARRNFPRRSASRGTWCTCTATERWDPSHSRPQKPSRGYYRKS